MIGYMTGMGTTPGMWEMVSEALNGEKLPESVNAAIYALIDDEAIIIPRSLAIKILDALSGVNEEDRSKLEANMTCSRERK